MININTYQCKKCERIAEAHRQGEGWLIQCECGNIWDAPIWHQLPDEPDLWYKRFVIYKNMAGKRTIAGANRIAKTLEAEETADSFTNNHQDSPSNRASDQWYTMHQLYRWEERARAWEATLEDDDPDLAETKKRLQRKRLLVGEVALDKLIETLTNPNYSIPPSALGQILQSVLSQNRADANQEPTQNIAHEFNLVEWEATRHQRLQQAIQTSDEHLALTIPTENGN